MAAEQVAMLGPQTHREYMADRLQTVGMAQLRCDLLAERDALYLAWAASFGAVLAETLKQIPGVCTARGPAAIVAEFVAPGALDEDMLSSEAFGFYLAEHHPLLVAELKFCKDNALVCTRHSHRELSRVECPLPRVTVSCMGTRSRICIA